MPRYEIKLSFPGCFDFSLNKIKIGVNTSIKYCFLLFPQPDMRGRLMYASLKQMCVHQTHGRPEKTQNLHVCRQYNIRNDVVSERI